MNGPNAVAVPPTISQDAYCDYCDEKHLTVFNERSGPPEFHYRHVISCPWWGRFVAKMNLSTRTLQVQPAFVGHIHLSPPLVVDQRHDRRNRFHDWRARQAPAPIPAPPPPRAAVPAPPPRPLPNKKFITLSLTMTNDQITYKVQHEITLDNFSLKSLPEHVQHHLHVSEIAPRTLQICMANDWKNVPAQGTDVSEVRNHDILRLRAVSNRFPLTYARDMAAGLLKYSVLCREDPVASVDTVFETSFPGIPWKNNGNAFLDAQRLWNSLPPRLKEKYSTADRNDDFTWARVVGAADVARDLSPELQAAGGSLKRKRRASSEPEFLDHAPPRRTTVKTEPQDHPPLKKKRRHTEGKVIEIYDDDEIIDLTK